MDGDKVFASGVLVASILWILALILVSSLSVPKSEAVENGHAIYAPQSGVFMWLEKGD